VQDAYGRSTGGIRAAAILSKSIIPRGRMKQVSVRIVGSGYGVETDLSPVVTGLGVRYAKRRYISRRCSLMSMNLYCNKVELRQTPTWVTNICMMTDKGPAYNVTGKDAQRALLCYIEWIKSLGRTSWDSSEQEDVDEEVAIMNNHIKEVKKTFKDKKLTVSIM
jgi:hypothetical protein